MKTACRLVVLSLIGLVGADDPARPAPAEVLERAEGASSTGRVASDPKLGFVFAPEDGTAPIRLAPGMTVRFQGAGPPRTTGLPPFRVDVGLDQRLSGRLGAVNGAEVVLLDAIGDARVAIARGGARSLVQRPGESVVLEDGFESIDTRRWSTTGEPDVSTTLRTAGAKSLALPVRGASLTHRIAEPFGAGRLELAVHDTGAVAPDLTWRLELTFRGANGPETARILLGWAEESLAVETRHGPALAVQRLARTAGWHRLAIRFTPERCEIAVDGNELAHGKGFGGPLAAIRLETVGPAKGAPPADLAAHVDDLRLVRLAQPVTNLEVDVTQDEVRMTSGDQVFGTVEDADPERIVAKVDGRDALLPWSDVSGVYFRRASTAGATVSGLLVRVEWRSAPGDDPRDLDRIEGALLGATPAALTVATPYAGTLTIPRERLSRIQVVGRGVRQVVDNAAHHLGDSISTTPPILDPPQPEGGVLERAFELPTIPAGPVTLVLDVVQVVGEAADLPFSALIQKGELRTNVALNGAPFDYLNHYIATRNESPERIRLVLPKKSLRRGRNVVRFEQVGIASDPNYLDDLGLLGVAVEYDPPAP